MAGKEPNWDSAANQPPSEVHALWRKNPFPVVTIWCNSDVARSWMNLKSPIVKMASFKPTRQLFFFSFRTLILLQLVISPSLHRYLVSVPWQWQERRKFCFLRVAGFFYPKVWSLNQQPWHCLACYMFVRNANTSAMVLQNKRNNVYSVLVSSKVLSFYSHLPFP